MKNRTILKVTVILFGFISLFINSSCKNIVIDSPETVEVMFLSSQGEEYQSKSILNKGYVITNKDIPNLKSTDIFSFNGWKDNTGKQLEEGYKLVSDTVFIASWVEQKTLPVVLSHTASEIDYKDEVNLLCNTKDAKIYYTLDGTVPTMETGTLYENPIQIFNETNADLGKSVTLKAKAFRESLSPSDETEITYNMRTFTITYKIDKFGNSREPITNLKKGDKILSSYIPDLGLSQDKEYIFDGWTDNNGNPITTDTVVSRNIELVPNWTAYGTVGNIYFSSGIAYSDDYRDYQDKFSVSLSCNTKDVEIYYTYTLDGTDPINPTKQAKNIDGSKLYSEKLSFTMGEKPIKIKAIAYKDRMKPSKIYYKEYKLKTYSIEYVTGTEQQKFDNVINLKKGDKIQSKDLPILNPFNNLVFEGWKNNEGQIVKEGDEITENLILTASWFDKSNFIIKADKSGNINCGQSVTLSSNSPVAKIYYTTDGSDPKDETNEKRKEYTSPITITKDTTIKAYAELHILQEKFTTDILETSYLVFYKITYKNTGFGVTNNNVSTFSSKTKFPINLYELTKEDSIFEGLYYNSDYSGSKVESIDINPYENITLYAKWSNKPPAKVEVSNWSVGSKQVTIRWINPSDKDLQKVIIEYGIKGFSKGTVEIDVIPNTLFEYTLTNLKNNNTYDIKLYAFDGELRSEPCTISVTPTVVYIPTSQPRVLPLGTNGTAGTNCKYIEFGDWPQTIKNQNVSIISNTPVKINGWNCYLGDDDNFYVPVYTSGSDFYNNTFSNGEVRKTYTEYYFKMEPIKWRVLDDNVDGGKLLFSEKCLTNGPFHNSNENRNIDYKYTYPNNYKYSAIRYYLNSYSGTYDDSGIDDYTGVGFIDKAFTKDAIKLIRDYELDNSVYSAQDINGELPAPDEFVCSYTVDKIFLLSAREITDPKYGFKGAFEEDPVRQKEATDYLKAQGVGESSKAQWFYLLRSPATGKDSVTNRCRLIHNSGIASWYGGVTWVYRGIAPALCLKRF